jgi:hypothetical protein
MLLRVSGHIGHPDGSAHEGRPGLFREGLKVREVPKLPFVHLDLGNAVVEYPSTQHGETTSLGIAEHVIRQSFPHRNPAFSSIAARDSQRR